MSATEWPPPNLSALFAEFLVLKAGEVFIHKGKWNLLEVKNTLILYIIYNNR